MSARVFASTKNLSYAGWLELRKQGIGGSNAAVACGISHYKSPMELWMEKTGQLLPQEAGEAAYWGTLLESVVREEFTKRTGIEVTKPSVILQSEEFPFMLARIRGRKGGRPCCDQHKLNQAIKLYAAGQHTVAEIEDLTGIKKSTLYRYLRCHQ